MSPTASRSCRSDGDLPFCRFRQAARQTSHVLCDSPILRIYAAVHSDVCRTCAFPDVATLERRPGARAQCLYRGDRWRSAELSHGLDQGSLVDVYSCGIHGECTDARAVMSVQCCATCEQFRARDDSPSAHDSPTRSVDAMVEVLRGPRRAWPADWPYWGTTLEAHRILAREHVDNLPAYPHGKYAGRGIVILGGGAFFPGVYVTVKMIRHFGCTLPIEVWHHGDAEPVLHHWLEPLGARCVDLEARARSLQSPPRIHGAWASKVFAIIHSSFEEVLYLDSDCYPVHDVSPMFDTPHSGALFWPDLASSNHWIDWFVYPAPPRKGLPVNGGQMLLDKSKCWRALLLAQWWCERADYSFVHNLGDQDVILGSWHYLQQPLTLACEHPTWKRPAYLICTAQDGETPLFVHRVHDKFRVPWLPMPCADGNPIRLYRWDRMGGETQYRDDLPAEDVAFGYFHEFQRRFEWDPERFRPGTWDEQIWREVCTGNGYNLPQQMPSGSVVIDVGAHVGSFTHLALRRGAAKSWAFEADSDNYLKCKENLAFWGLRVVLRHQAVWSNGGRVGFVPPPKDFNVIGHVIPDGNALEAVPLDEVIDEALDGENESVYVVKLDCEGSEWPILFASQKLALCDNVVGEYHCKEWEGKLRGPDDLCLVLHRHGFAVRTHPFNDSIGVFWATKASDQL